MPDEPYANMTLRVRRSLDVRVAKLVNGMNLDHGLKTSKAQLVELLLSKLPDVPSSDLMAELREFQRDVPR